MNVSSSDRYAASAERDRLRARVAEFDQVLGDKVLPVTEQLSSYDTFTDVLWSMLPAGPAKDALELRRQAAKRVHDALCSLYAVGHD